MIKGKRWVVSIIIIIVIIIVRTQIDPTAQDVTMMAQQAQNNKFVRKWARN